MRKKFRLFLIALSVIFVVSAGWGHYHFHPDYAPKLLTYSKGEDYNQLWQKVDSLQKKGLTRSVLDVLDVIYEKAEQDNNAPQIAKVLLHQLKFKSYIREDAYFENVNELTEEAAKARYPLKPLLHSMIGEIYWGYYQKNRWRFHQRTKTLGFDNEDMRTWSLEQLIDATKKQYLLSLHPADSLKITPVSTFDEVITEPVNADLQRPTLYDFLAHRAVAFFMNEEPSVTVPVYQFQLDKPDYLKPFDRYAEMELTTKDSTSLKFHALAILQELILLHKDDPDPSALVDADLKRLEFVRNNAAFSNKDSLYIQRLEQLFQAFETDESAAEIMYKRAVFHNNRGADYRPESGENKWERKKAVALCKTAMEKYPGSYGAKRCKSLLFTMQNKSLQVKAEEGNVPGKPFRTFISYRNIANIHQQILKVDYQKYADLRRNSAQEAFLSFLKDHEPVEKWEVKLPDDGDYNSHSTEYKVPALDKGFYVLLTSTNENYSIQKEAVNVTPLWVTDISYISRRKEDGNFEFVVSDRESGKPIEGVKAEFYQQEYSYIKRRYEYRKKGSETSDKNGMVSSPLVSRYSYFQVHFKKGADAYISNSSFYSYNYGREQKKEVRTTFYTDRGIYRPGQTIYFKGIVIETDGEESEIETGYQTTVKLYDANRQVVAEETFTTNEYGSFSGSFTAPASGLTGQMYLEDGHGTKYFRVEEYKRPKFEVNFQPVKGTYKLNEEVSLQGEAKSYSGANIDGAEVSWRVVRNANFPYWCFWRIGYWPQSPEVEISNGTGQTDSRGKFTVDFTAVPDPIVPEEFSPAYSYTIYADVTDINGETHSTQTNVYVGYNALKLGMNLPGEVNTKRVDTFYISATNLNGQPQPANVDISVWKLNTPDHPFRDRMWNRPDTQIIEKDKYKELFPFDPYDDEHNKSKWEKGEKVLDRAFSTDTTRESKQFYIEEIEKWEPGQYIMEMKAKDSFGEKVKYLQIFSVYNEDKKKMPVREFAWFTTLKGKGEPGDTASFLIGSAARNVQVLYEIEHKNAIVERKWISLNDEIRKVEIPILEKHRGNFAVHFAFVKNNRSYSYNRVITVPYTNKQLDVQFETFRNKLYPGQKEEWKIKISGKKGEKIAAEMVATMYDASLDEFAANYWGLNVFQQYYSRMSWGSYHSFNASSGYLYQYQWNDYYNYPQRRYRELNWYGFNPSYNYSYRFASHSRATTGAVEMESVAEQTIAEDALSEPHVPAKEKKAEFIDKKDLDKSIADEEVSGLNGKNQQQDFFSVEAGRERAESMEMIKARTNFNETAFFYPHLQTNERGEVIIEFTIPEALTRWKFMGLAHTRDLKSGSVTEETVTQKELMVFPNAPRYFREGDTLFFTSKITNLSDEKLKGKAQLKFFNSLTMEDITDKLMLENKRKKLFEAGKKQSDAVQWKIRVPEGLPAVTYRVVAQSGNFTDGEEKPLPVLSNRMLVTESLPLPIRGKQTKTYKFDKLVNDRSKTLRHHRLTLEFTSNPAWYAVQALPYMMEYPYECAEQVFSRYYANSIASHIANSNPKVKRVFDAWKERSPDSFLSNLQKNEELKSLVLEETPWILESEDESERKKRVGLLFDMNRMSRELDKSLRKLTKMQSSNGGWPWFEGMPESRYITRHIIAGMGHLDHLGISSVREDAEVWNAIEKAVHYLDQRILEDYLFLKKHGYDMDKNHLGHAQVQYLYARSYFKDIRFRSGSEKSFEYYRGQAKKYWLKNNYYLQGMIALALNRYGDESIAEEVIASLKENAIFHEEMGMYWKGKHGYYWYQAPIERQALLIEAFDEVTGDTEAVNAMRVWLLKQKQTQDWKTTKATAEACYALLLKGADWLADDTPVEISVGNLKVNSETMDGVEREAGTGYFKTSWSGKEIKPEMGHVTVTKKTDGVAWGSLYWQYFEDLDKITTHETPLKLKKELFVERNTDSGPVIVPLSDEVELKAGDKIKVRIVLKVDRTMNYVHMKDMRASGLEPVNVLSGHKYQDGLSYYQSTRDASVNFFFSNLSKGTYVFEYVLRANIAGSFSNGITTIQCMYAPEFTSHSEGMRVTVGNE